MSADLPQSERRFVLVVAAHASRATVRRVRTLVLHSPIGARSRVEVVANVEDAARRLRDLPADEVAVAAGGDGTANLLAQALRLEREQPIMGVLPLGTGNALAHALGCGTPARALDVLQNGEWRAHDVLLTTHTDIPLALASISTGFEGRFIARWSRRRRFGIPGAAATLLREAARARSSIRLDADGQTLVDAPVFSAGVYNIPCYANGRLVWRGARSDDGVAEAAASSHVGEWLDTVGRGRDPTAAHIRQCHHATLETAAPIQYDGETAAAGVVEITVAPAALRVFAAAPTASGEPRVRPRA